MEGGAWRGEMLQERFSDLAAPKCSRVVGQQDVHSELRNDTAKQCRK